MKKKNQKLETRQAKRSRVEKQVSSQKEKRNKQWTFGVLWYLLNVSTQLKCDTETIIKVMRSIEEFSPLTLDTWKGNGKIIVNGRTVFEWNSNQISFAGQQGRRII